MVNELKHSRTVWSPSSRWFVVLLISVGVPACEQSDADMANGDDPMEALSVPHVSERYGTQYWRLTKTAEPDLWAQALRFCEGSGNDLREYPNCYAVRQVAAFEEMTQLPEDQPDTFNLMMEPWDQDSTSARR